ncbi:MAG TPA: hypothetical protein PKL58_01530 [Methylophilaceae bacterium]|nr:hypothetical protein [Methylophilaceae bacterium]HQO15644.1 hypothetical protein [Methylotenera sp.]
MKKNHDICLAKGKKVSKICAGSKSIYVEIFTREKFNALRAFIYKACRVTEKVDAELML